MSPTLHLLLLFAGLAVVLSLASAVGFVLARRSPDNPVVENLNDRVRAWWVMIAVVGLAFVVGRVGFVLLFALASFMALREFITLTRTRMADHGALVASFFVVLPMQYVLVGIEWYGLFVIFIPVYAFLLLPVLVVLKGQPQGFLERVAEVQWGLMIAVYCLSYVPALAILEIPGNGGRELLLIAFLVLIAQANDVLQYVFGKLFGRTKLAPSVSPSKTWEGFIGGGASAILLGVALTWLTPFSPLRAAALAAVIVAMGTAGGLVMSAIKRDRGVKDWGHVVAGHGGVLDRVDSVVFAAPVFFHLVRYFWT